MSAFLCLGFSLSYLCHDLVYQLLFLFVSLRNRCIFPLLFYFILRPTLFPQSPFTILEIRLEYPQFFHSVFSVSLDVVVNALPLKLSASLLTLSITTPHTPRTPNNVLWLLSCCLLSCGRSSVRRGLEIFVSWFCQVFYDGFLSQHHRPSSSTYERTNYLACDAPILYYHSFSSFCAISSLIIITYPHSPPLLPHLLFLIHCMDWTQPTL